MAPVGDRNIERDPVQPRFGRRVGLPGPPRSKGADERLLCTVFGGRPLAEDPNQRGEDTRKAIPIQAVEIFGQPRTVGRLDYRLPHRFGRHAGT